MESDYRIRHYFHSFSSRPIIVMSAFYLINNFQSNHPAEINCISFLFLWRLRLSESAKNNAEIKEVFVIFSCSENSHVALSPIPEAGLRINYHLW